jgi:AcrR family transcriptional regulator
MPKAFSPQERERIESRLIAVGKRLINKAGIRFLVVDDIAREAGISKGSFYSFHPSREEFILAVFESWEKEHRGALIRDVVEGEGSVREKLERFFIGAFRILEKEPGLATLGVKDIQMIMERLPPERIEAHKAADERALAEAFGGGAGMERFPPTLLTALQGLAPALFAIALHREDFPPESYQATVKLLAEALAARIAADVEGATATAAVTAARKGETS